MAGETKKHKKGKKIKQLGDDEVPSVESSSDSDSSISSASVDIIEVSSGDDPLDEKMKKQPPKGKGRSMWAAWRLSVAGEWKLEKNQPVKRRSPHSDADEDIITNLSSKKDKSGWSFGKGRGLVKKHEYNGEEKLPKGSENSAASLAIDLCEDDEHCVDGYLIGGSYSVSPAKKRKRVNFNEVSRVSDVLVPNIRVPNSLSPQPYILPRFSTVARRSETFKFESKLAFSQQSLDTCKNTMEGETSDDDIDDDEDDDSSTGCASVDNMTIKINFVDEVERTSLRNITSEEGHGGRNSTYHNLHIDFNSPLKVSPVSSNCDAISPSHSRWLPALIASEATWSSSSPIGKSLSHPPRTPVIPLSPCSLNTWFTEPYRKQLKIPPSADNSYQYSKTFSNCQTDAHSSPDQTVVPYNSTDRSCLL
jgi:hypothetical protein